MYVCCTGDGIDANSRTAYSGIVFSGGQTVVISNSGMNSAIDTEQGYRVTGGSVVAVMPSRGMSGEATHCEDFSSVGTKATISLNAGSWLTVTEGGKQLAAVKMPVALSAMVVYLGSNSAKVATADAVSGTPDSNGVCWSGEG